MAIIFMQIYGTLSVLRSRLIWFPWEFYASIKAPAVLRDSVFSLSVLY
jgi:hypothetical protein